MWNGKNKAITFSFDDGVTQDERAIEILNKYGLKATFNLNSAYLGIKGSLICNNVEVSHIKIGADKVKNIYSGHEVACHTLTHPLLTKLDDFTVIRQVEEDRKALEAIVGYPVVGMAYPNGGVNNDDRVASVIAENTPIKYARTITSTYSFDLQSNLLRFNPTVSYIDKRLFELADAFLNMKTDRPQLFYIWGHTYEMDANCISWDNFERLCKLLSGRDDVFYGTNAETLLY